MNAHNGPSPQNPLSFSFTNTAFPPSNPHSITFFNILASWLARTWIKNASVLGSLTQLLVRLVTRDSPADHIADDALEPADDGGGGGGIAPVVLRHEKFEWLRASMLEIDVIERESRHEELRRSTVLTKSWYDFVESTRFVGVEASASQEILSVQGKLGKREKSTGRPGCASIGVDTVRDWKVVVSS